MANKAKYIDMAGLTPIVNGIRVNATKPGQLGTELTATEALYLDGITAGTAAASKAVVVGSDSTVLMLGVKAAPVAIADAASYAVLVANSDHLHVVPDVTADITVTLPAAASGLTYEFIYGGAAADAQNHIFVPTAGFYIGGVTFHDSQADATTAVYSDGNSNDVFTIVTPAAYTVKFVSNGTNWYVTGNVQSATVCTMAD
jgi:hypothetical protein